MIIDVPPRPLLAAERRSDVTRGQRHGFTIEREVWRAVLLAVTYARYATRGAPRR